MRKIAGLLVLVGFSLLAFAQSKRLDYSKVKMKVLEKAPVQPEKEVKKSSEEWKKELSEQEYYVLREAGTEPPNSPIYKQFKDQGNGAYYCSGCGVELFSSETKFDSRSGWPSFYDGVKGNIKLDEDHHLGYKRVEVRCAKCDGHLGHVFDGEGFGTPTDKRYCINGVCLTFLPDGEGKKK